MKRELPETPPGVKERPPGLVEELAEALECQDQGYQPRTRHLRDGGAPRFVNRLIKETSPYLRQHAHNPVDWRPWGDEAFAEAKARGVPVLLSVGYATCHWCHVMEEESFEDEEVAAAMNAHFVPVKVDREERPDVDNVYMACVQAWSGQGGWPMTVFLTADRQPFFGGTYFPARDGDRGTHTGFLTLLTELRRVHAEQPERVERAAREVVDAVRSRVATASGHGSALPDAGVLHGAYRLYQRLFDETWGGLARAPKFPSSLPVRFLLRYQRRFGGEALAMAERTLDAMARGGLRDQIGGGFHRYSVDEEWLVPHFEKMLYDNALLTEAYVEAFQATGKKIYADVAASTLDYVLREMTAPHGGFYSATDADSANPEKHGEREEGWFFTWTPAELDEVLGPELARRFAAYYGVTDSGNFEGRSILHVAQYDAAVQNDLAEARDRLYAARRHRPPPLLDDKTLAAWNGLMISAMARAARPLQEPRYLAAATRAARFLLTEMTVDGALRRSYRGTVGTVPAFLEDHACVVQALIDVYEAGFDVEFLRAAIKLADDCERFAAPAAEGGYYTTTGAHESLLVREKPAYDGATPSGNSVLTLSHLRLAALTGAPRWRERAEKTLRTFRGVLAEAPAALGEMLLSVDFLTDHPRQVVLVTGKDLQEAAPFLDLLAKTFVPNKVVAASPVQSRPTDVVPLFADRVATNGRATAYICEGTHCRAPTQDRAVFAAQLSEEMR